MISKCDDDGSDINATLAELIDKVRDYPCMVATRRRMYHWAKLNDNLLGLCRGDYDTFCDGGDIINQQALDTCPVSADFVGAGDEKEMGGSDSKRRRQVDYAKNGLFEMDTHNEFEMNNEGNSTGIGRRHDTLFAVCLIIYILLNFIGCCYLNHRRNKKDSSNGVKYVDDI